MENLLKLYTKYLKPKFYNKLTWLIVFAGISVICTPIWERIFELIFRETFDLKLTDGNNWLVGFALVSLGLFYNLLNVYVDARGATAHEKEKKAKAAQHDLEKFKELNSLLSESDIMGIIDFIGTNHAYKKYQKAKLDEYLYQASKTDNEFICQELDLAKNEFLDALDRFRIYLSYNFFYAKEDMEMEYLYLYPDLNPDRGGDMSKQSRKKYLESSEELHKIGLEAEDAFKKYRQEVKERLYV